MRNRWVFEALCRRRGRRTLEAGEYFFDHPVTSFDVFDTLANGRVFVRELVVPEGYSMFDLADLVEREGFTSARRFSGGGPRSRADPRSSAERAQRSKGSSSRRPMNFPGIPVVGKWSGRWSSTSAGNGPCWRGSSTTFAGLGLEQVVTLASLVERETPKADERPLVAGVFANRLSRRQPLECDPTVVYAMELAGQYGGALSARDLPFESPYNTYRHTGLPPGPIANPGEASLRAALAPAATDYLYFVADTEGGHFFSKTLVEHDRNVARFRRRLAAERAAGHASDPPAVTDRATPHSSRTP